MNVSKPLLDPVTGEQLVQIARRTLTAHVRQQASAKLNPAALPPLLRAPGAAFVTLTQNGQLRGCIGNCERHLPLAEAVAQHALSAATRDPRFAPVTPEEVDGVRLEVTVLTPLQQVRYKSLAELPAQIRPFQDGVMLVWGEVRGVLLPQMWTRIPEPSQFLAAVARKAQIPRAALIAQPPTVVVYTFQAQHFCESGYRAPGS